MKRLLLLLIFAPIASLMAQSGEVDLYSGSVPVENQSERAREAAFPAALEQVLGKLSGLRNFEDRPEIEPAVRDARSLVVSFHYQQVIDTTLAPTADGGAAEPAAPKTHLVARFSEGGVDELMRRLDLPRWPPAREPLIVWLLIDDGQSRRVLPVEYAYLRTPLDRAAAERGLSLQWPEPGPDGEYAVDVQLLWGGYTDEIPAGQGDGNVFLIAARREGREWNTRLILDYGDEHSTWRSHEIDLTQALSAAMHQAVDEIAAARVIAPSQQGSWVYEISVSGMNSGEAYARSLGYLEGLSIVDEVSVESAAPGGVRLSLRLNTTPEYFEQLLAEDHVLETGETSGHYVLQP
jgi:hypothetical protein